MIFPFEKADTDNLLLFSTCAKTQFNRTTPFPPIYIMYTHVVDQVNNGRGKNLCFVSLTESSCAIRAIHISINGIYLNLYIPLWLKMM